MESNAATDTLATAAYYNDLGVTKFYELCWGGSDIHIGLYATGDEKIADASEAMTRHLLERSGVRADHRVLDIACGFGGTLRLLAKSGCHAKGIDISQVCVDKARKANVEAGLDPQIEVNVGDFHAIDTDADSWDAVICQEARIHSSDRPKVFDEVFRVLRRGGVFVFSDILTAEGADITMVEAAFARLGAPAGATAHNYQEMARKAGFQIRYVEERPNDIRTHYAKLAEILAKPVVGLDADVAGSILKSIRHWQAALGGGHITWACFVARKPF
jgi:cyclopropane fatty-acyl-phospholipid synthase-like methyltransferase